MIQGWLEDHMLLTTGSNVDIVSSLLGGVMKEKEAVQSATKTHKSSNLAGEDLIPVLLGLVVPGRGVWWKWSR